MKHPVCLLSSLMIALGASLAGATESRDVKPSVELRIVKFVRPEFPGIALQEGVAEGTVVVAFSHDLAGRVTDALALESTHPAFAREAIAAVQQWQIAPHGEKGAPCQCAHVIRLAFEAGGVMRMASTPSRTNGTSELATSGAGPTSSVLTFDDLDARPKVLRQSMPALPISATNDAKHRAVSVTFFVDREGRVRVPSIVSTPDPMLGAAVAQAMLQWRYESPRKGGKTVAALAEMNFNLNAAAAPDSFAAAPAVAGAGGR